LSPDGKAMAAACGDRSVRLWDLEGRKVKAVLPHGNAVLSGASEPFEVRLWDVPGITEPGKNK
jgi:WD40 repeat protein